MSSSSPYLGRGGGGGRAYGLLEVEIAVKSTTSFSSTITNSSSSSPSSTLSESSPLAISTRKPRSSRRRKRPNQTYNEAAALLSTAYPKIFSLPAPLPNHPPHSLPFDSSDLLLPLRALDSATRFLPIREQEPKLAAAAEVSSRWQHSSATGNWKENGEEEEEDFDAESMLDEEFEQVGIDSIMGGTAMMNNNEALVINHNLLNHHPHQYQQANFVYGYPPEFHHPYWSGGDVNNYNNNNRAFRRSLDDWWNYPVVDVLQISPRLHSVSTNQMTVTRNVDGGGEIDEKAKQSTTTASEEKIDKSTGNNKQKKKKLKMKKIAKLGGEEVKEAEETKEDSKLGRNLLKLNYDEVLKEWSGKGSPFPEDTAGCGFLEEGCDASAIATQIDLFLSDGNGGGGGGGVREASVLRYKEKRLNRLFSKKIRYQVRKVNADQRPRMKGRFVRRPSANRNSRSRSHVNHKDNKL